METVPGLNGSLDFVGKSMYLAHPKLALITYKEAPPKKMGCLAKKGCHAAISPSKREKTESLSCSRTFFTSAFPRGQKKGDAVKAQGIYVKCLINNVCCKNDSYVVCIIIILWCYLHKVLDFHIYHIYRVNNSSTSAS